MSTVFGYWGIRGIAQPLRYLLEYLDVKFEDKRYISRDVWLQQKELFRQKDALANIPYLQHEGITIFESSAIATYLIEKFNRTDLLGTTIEDKVAIAQIEGVISDFKRSAQSVFFAPKEEFEAKGKEMFKTSATPYLKKLEFIVNGKKFVTGDNVSIADFSLYEATDTVKTFDETLLEPYPNLVKQHHNFSEIPQIKKYLASDRFIARPFLPAVHSNWG